MDAVDPLALLRGNSVPLEAQLPIESAGGMKSRILKIIRLDPINAIGLRLQHTDDAFTAFLDLRTVWQSMELEAEGFGSVRIGGLGSPKKLG